MKKNPKASSKTDAPEPMDPGFTSDTASAPSRERNAYALDTLVAEVQALFPETPYEVSNRDGRGVALDVTFDLTALDEGAASDLSALLDFAREDFRVLDVLAEDGQVHVSFRSSLRTQDSREPFGLGDAYDILTAQDEPESAPAEDDEPETDDNTGAEQ